MTSAPRPLSNGENPLSDVNAGLREEGDNLCSRTADLYNKHPKRVLAS